MAQQAPLFGNPYHAYGPYPQMVAARVVGEELLEQLGDRDPINDDESDGRSAGVVLEKTVLNPFVSKNEKTLVDLVNDRFQACSDLRLAELKTTSSRNAADLRFRLVSPQGDWWAPINVKLSRYNQHDNIGATSSIVSAGITGTRCRKLEDAFNAVFAGVLSGCGYGVLAFRSSTERLASAVFTYEVLSLPVAACGEGGGRPLVWNHSNGLQGHHQLAHEWFWRDVPNADGSWPTRNHEADALRFLHSALEENEVRAALLDAENAACRKLLADRQASSDTAGVSPGRGLQVGSAGNRTLTAKRPHAGTATAPTMRNARRAAPASG